MTFDTMELGIWSSLTRTPRARRFVPAIPKALRGGFCQFSAAILYDLADRQNEQIWQAIMYVVLCVIEINAHGEVSGYAHFTSPPPST